MDGHLERDGKLEHNIWEYNNNDEKIKEWWRV